MHKTQKEEGAFRVFAYPPLAYRIRHSEQPGELEEDLPDLPLEGRREAIAIVKDSESKIVARRKGFRFVQDPPTGTFRVDNDGQALLRGRIGSDDSAGGLFSLRLPSATEVYGLGAFEGGADRNRGRYLLRNIDTLFYSMPGQSYSSFPFLLFRSDSLTCGLLIYTSFPLGVEMVRNNDLEEGLEVKVSGYRSDEEIPLDIVLFTGTVPEIYQSLAAMTGQPFLPPVWALGYHQSRWSYKSQERVLEIARQARQNGLPLDAIHLDIHHMDRYRVFTWNKETFAEPERMHAELGELGVRTVAIVDPGVAAAEDSEVFQSGLQGDHFCRTPAGATFYGRVWPGKTAFPDFTREDTRYWWARQHRDLFAAGVSGIWNDMNEPVFRMGKAAEPLREDVVHEKGSHLRYRNLYANLEAMATREAFSIWKPGSRPFVLSRAGFTGIQRYAALWTGDNHSTWEHLRDNLHMVINLGLSGQPFSGADIGGFGSRAGILGTVKLRRKPELFTRWVELGSLMPFFRVHSTLYSYAQEPWAYGPHVLEHVRKHVLRRYALLPYLYSLFWESHQTGAPIVRPLFFEFPGVPYAETSTQFMLGSALLAAPVLSQGVLQRSVVLPPGEWYDYETGEIFEGDRTVERPAAPGSYPLFVRAGTMVPQCTPGQNASESLRGELFLDVLPGPEVHGRLILDDGLSLDHEQGKTFEAILKGKRDRNGDLSLSWSVQCAQFQPAQTKAVLRLPMQYRQMTHRSKKIPGRPRTLVSEGRSAQMMEYEISIVQDWEATFAYRNLLPGEAG